MRPTTKTATRTLALAALLLAAPAFAQDDAAPHRTFDLYAGQVKVIPSPPLARVAVGNGHLLGVTTLSRQILFIAEKPGTTDVYVWRRDGSQRDYHIVVFPSDDDQTYADLQALLPEFPGVAAHISGGQVILFGSASPGELDRLKRAIRAYPDVVDLVRPDTVRMRRMVVLDVQVVNFSKTALDNLGIDWQQAISGPAVGLVGDFVSNGLYRLGDVSQGGQAANTLNGPNGPITGLPLNVPPFASYAGAVTSISSTINLAVQNGQAYILANPRLVTRSGGTASFLAGGEVPIPVSSAFGQTTVTYKKYGVKLRIKPLVDGHGDILAAIGTEVSQINPALTINGYPAFLDRDTQAVVNVKSGQTIVLSGLVHATGANSVNKFPWLGDLPILGALFRSTQFQHDQSELVIFVTPEVIDPNSPQSRALVAQARGYMTRFDRDYARGYFVPGIGHDPDTAPYPQFPPKATAATGSAP